MLKNALCYFFALTFSSIFAQVNFIIDDLELAKSQAKELKKYILVDVSADWCVYCKKMENTTFRDSSVSNFVHLNMVAVKLDIDKEIGNQFATEHGITGLPTLVILDYKGNLIQQVVGFMNASDILQLLAPYELEEKNKTSNNHQLSELLDLKKEYFLELENRLPIELDSILLDIYTFGEKKDYESLAKFKYTNTQLDELDLKRITMWYYIGSGLTEEAFEEFKEIEISQFDSFEAEYLVSYFLFVHPGDQSILSLINELSTSSATIDLLSVKALCQYASGDIEDVKTTLKKIKKLAKSQEIELGEWYNMMKEVV